MNLSWLPWSVRGFRREISEKLSLRHRRTGLSYDPYDRAAREKLAEELFKLYGKDEPLGTIDRGRFLLRVIEEGFPTQNLTAEYFRNLECLLKDKRKRVTPGKVLLGVGTGRCGSTSLAALFAGIDNSCCTHENPPLVYWSPEPEQIEFHIKRFKLLSEYFSLVVDVSHWWLNVLDIFFEFFPDAKIVGMVRDTKECADSFMWIRGYGRGSWNHWVPYGNGIWIAHSWDPTYPTYAIPSSSERNPPRAKYRLITRYITEYNAKLRALAESMQRKVMLVPTPHISEVATQQKIFDFAGLSGQVTNVKLNIRSVQDARSPIFKF